MATPGEHVGKRLCKSVAHVFIEEKFHATEFTSRRSRAAANARHARMSSRVRSGKSFRISSSLIPPARYSKTSYTVILVPLTHGLPLRTAGFIKIRSCQFMRELYLAGREVLTSGARSPASGHRGRTASCSNRPRTDPGVPFSSTGLFRNTRFRVRRHERKETDVAVRGGAEWRFVAVALRNSRANHRSPSV